ncbi:MAG: aminopeptidase [Desulfurococcales archaeon]|nr:aminopeptidase [Desulfurococcales archaeon]
MERGFSGFNAHVDRLARLVVDYCLGLREGDEVLVSFSLEAVDLARAIAFRAIDRGAYPHLRLTLEDVNEYFHRFAPRSVLERVSPIEEYTMERVDALVSIIGPRHSKPLAGVDPERLALRTSASRRLTEIFMRRDGEGSLRWTVTAYPTPSMAQEAGMTPLEMEYFVYRALKLHEEDPVEAWRRQAESQEAVRRILSRASELRVVGENTDITFRVEGRTWINDDGRKNMPGGEVFSAPHEDGVDGEIYFEFPLVWRGVELRGVRLRFRRGEVVEASAEVGGEVLQRLLKVDDGARRLGELAFGLNYDIQRHTKIVLFDEKIGGTMHMALGAAYPATGGTNKSSIHVDIVKDLRRNAKVYADGDLIFEDGRFLVETA